VHSWVRGTLSSVPTASALASLSQILTVIFLVSPLVCVIVVILLFLLSGSLGVGVSAAESHTDLVGPLCRCVHGNTKCLSFCRTCGDLVNTVCGAGV